MTSPVVLILTHPDDVHADAVQAHLGAARVEVRRIDTAQLGGLSAPVTAHLRHGAVTGNVAGVSLSRVVGVWHRRPSEFTTTDAADAAELRAGVGGVLAPLPYLNRPANMAVAGFKPYQLVVAAFCGLSVPETMVSTVARVASTMADRLGGGVVVKPMSRQVAGLIDEHDRAGWERAMHLTQQRIPTTRHVRLTVVDGTMFAAMIESPHLDWRRDVHACRYQVVDTPVEVAGPVRRLLARLRLRYAALDFAVDPVGRWWFLEVNPNGQFLWIEQATGLPIAAAIATALRMATPSRLMPTTGTATSDPDHQPPPLVWSGGDPV
jgi:glutathione synthase/RimK-type ligase-like ATP-grasp enzyme